MVRLEKLTNDLSQEDEAKTRGAIHHYRSTGTSDLSTKTTEVLANSQRLPRHLITIIQGKRNLRRELYRTTTGIAGRRRSLQVETILNHRKRGRGYQYFVKWQGYPITDASWEPEHAFSDDGDTLKTYKTRHNLL